jgi:hypothetical protein
MSFRPSAFLRVEAASRTGRSTDATAALGEVTATLNPFAGLSLSATASAGDRLVPVLTSIVPEAGEPIHRFDRLVSDAGGARIGGELAGAFGSLGVAAFRQGATILAPFSLPFDLGTPAVAVGEATGIESFVDLVVPGTRGALQLEGWFTHFLDLADRPYVPEQIGRAALTFHGLYFGEQLEPVFRFEGVHRGSALVAGGAGEAFGTVIESFQTLNFSMHLRIIDVRAFILWDNLLGNQTAITLPGAPAAPPRMVYGASWRFRN